VNIPIIKRLPNSRNLNEREREIEREREGVEDVWIGFLLTAGSIQRINKDIISFLLVDSIL
jgi:hypothetical protein